MKVQKVNSVAEITPILSIFFVDQVIKMLSAISNIVLEFENVYSYKIFLVYTNTALIFYMILYFTVYSLSLNFEPANT